MNRVHERSTAGTCPHLVDGFIWHLLNHLMHNTSVLSRQSGDTMQKGSRSHGGTLPVAQTTKPQLIKQLCWDLNDGDGNLEGTLESFWLRSFPFLVLLLDSKLKRNAFANKKDGSQKLRPKMIPLCFLDSRLMTEHRRSKKKKKKRLRLVTTL